MSNGEFHAFVADGGYSERKWWCDEGWRWANGKQVKHPTFWVPNPAAQGGYFYRAMLEAVPMRWDWPVDCNALEAAAFCRWKSARSGLSGAAELRLPTEDEWVALRDYAGYTSDKDEPRWGAASAPANLNLEHYASSCAVNRFAFGHGFYDVVGNVWQHTKSPLYALPVRSSPPTHCLLLPSHLTCHHPHHLPAFWCRAIATPLCMRTTRVRASQTAGTTFCAAGRGSAQATLPRATLGTPSPAPPLSLPLALTFWLFDPLQQLLPPPLLPTRRLPLRPIPPLNPTI